MDVRLDNRAPVQGRELQRKQPGSGLDRVSNAYDARGEIARVSRRRPNEKEELRAFLESKRRLIRSHPHLTSAEKASALVRIDEIAANLAGAAPSA
jgi:hypothetical protein